MHSHSLKFHQIGNGLNTDLYLLNERSTIQYVIGVNFMAVITFGEKLSFIMFSISLLRFISMYLIVLNPEFSFIIYSFYFVFDNLGFDLLDSLIF